MRKLSLVLCVLLLSSVVSPKCDSPVNYIFIGNPGVGKSALLNSLMRKILFKAGVSVGKGLTEIFEIHKDESQNKYIDTPGLADKELREKTAIEIKKALSQDGDYKIIFVVTLAQGRVKPEDLATMKLVLDAIPVVQNQYSIIINQMTQKYKDLFKKDTEKKAELFAYLKGTTNIFENLFDERLDGENDKLVEMSPELRKNITQSPTVHIKKEKVKDIHAEKFEKTTSFFEHILQNPALVDGLFKVFDSFLRAGENKVPDCQKACFPFTCKF